MKTTKPIEIIHREQLGAILKTARENTDLTQREISIYLGYSSAVYISRVESGRCAVSFEFLNKIIRLYKMNPEQLISLYTKQYREKLFDKLRKAGA